MKFKRKKLSGVLISLLAGLVVWSFGSAGAFAQTETGQISVKAIDPQGAVIAGATVTVKSVTTGAEKTTTTNEEGAATITNLQPGVYDVTVTASGFAPYKQQAQVTVGGRVTVEAAIAATAKGESITVVAQFRKRSALQSINRPRPTPPPNH